MKYEKGNPVQSMFEFADLMDNRKPVYFRHKFMSAGFIEHWPFIQVQKAINSRYLWTAIEKKHDTGGE